MSHSEPGWQHAVVPSCSQTLSSPGPEIFPIVHPMAGEHGPMPAGRAGSSLALFRATGDWHGCSWVTPLAGT